MPNSARSRTKLENNLLLFNALGCAHGCCEVFLLMEKVNRFDDQETLTMPVNQVLAITKDLEEAEGIVQILNQNGFSSEEIGVLTGSVADSPPLLANPGI